MDFKDLLVDALADLENTVKIVYDDLTESELLSETLYEQLLGIRDPVQRKQAEAMCRVRARKLGVTRDFNNCYSAYMRQAAKSGMVTTGNASDFPDQPLTLDTGEWTADARGVRHDKLVKGDTMVISESASPIPIMPTEILENVDDGQQKIRIAYYINGGWKSVLVERLTVASCTKILELANVGIEVNSENAKLLVKYIADCVALNPDVIPRYKSVSRLGWSGKKFIPYNDDIKFDGDAENKPLFDAVKQSGELDDWAEFVRPLRESIYLRLFMGASFASPLIEQLGISPFVVHLWGGTGSGKTVAMMIAMSIWGDPRMGRLVRSLNGTDNSIMSTAAFMYNLPLACDELQTVKNRRETLDALIMRLSEGIDRGRMKYDRNTAPKTWRCATLMTGEEPCTFSASGGGAINRVIDIECNEQIIANGNQVVEFILQNHGWAGLEYINFIRGLKHEQIRAVYDTYYKQILEQCNTTDKQALSMAAIATGDCFAHMKLFPDEQPLEVSQLRPFVVSSADVDVTERAYSFVINLVAANMVRFQITENHGEIWGSIKTERGETPGEDVNYYMINKDILIREMAAGGFSFDAVKSKWAIKGYLEKNSQGKMFHWTSCNGIMATFIKLKA